MANAEIIAVTGATGQQGGAVARELLNRGFSVRAITRNPNSPKTEALRKAGADVAVGNFDDPSSLQEAFKGADSVFIVSTPFEAGVEAETQQGIQAVDAAKAAGVKYLVFTSVASADSDTHIPHFDSKFRVEQHIRSVGVPFTIIAPAFFYDNTRSPFLLPGLQKGVFAMGLPAKVKLGCVATESIGSFAAHVFANRDKFLGKRVT